MGAFQKILERPESHQHLSQKCLCYTITSGGLTEGLLVEDTSFGHGIVVGDPSRGGWVLPMHRQHTPIWNGERLMRAVPHEIKRADDKVYWTLAAPRDNEGLVCKVETGNRSVKRTKVFQQIKSLAGSPVRVQSRRVHSRAGFLASLEEVWYLRPGDALEITFFDGAIYELRNKKGDLVYRHIDSLRERSLAERVEEARELIAKEGDGDEAVKARDAGYHKLLEVAQKGGIEWEKVSAVLMDALARDDLRAGVRRRFLEGCPFMTDFHAADARRLIAQPGAGSDAVKARDAGRHLLIDVAKRGGIEWESVLEELRRALAHDDLRVRVKERFALEAPAEFSEELQRLWDKQVPQMDFTGLPPAASECRNRKRTVRGKRFSDKPRESGKGGAKKRGLKGRKGK